MPADLPIASAAIFDLDGTLLDTLGDLADSVNAAMAMHGYPAHADEVVRSFIGNGAANLIRRAMPQQDREDAGLHAACLASFHQVYGENYANRTYAYDGVPELLADLQERDIPLGILSNKPHEFTRLCAKAYFDKQFSVVIGQRDSVPKKPDPTGAIEVARELGVDVGKCVYVGDSGVDIQTAKAAGMISVGVSWGFRPVAELEALEPAAVVHSAGEILRLFEE